MSVKNLLIVESPSKAKTITKYLNKSFTVLSSKGHVRGIPSKSNAVDVSKNFETEYEINPSSTKYLDAISKAAQKSTNIYMATDPDREGEAIAWHILEFLKENSLLNSQTCIQRITFNEVTPEAIDIALKNPRSIDMHLVAAQRARQSLDYLVGFSISPILWRKLPGCKSAGRVQSVALKLLCERENEILKFQPTDYWSILGIFYKQENFTTELYEINDQKIEKFSFLSEELATSLVNILQKINYSVFNIETKELSKNPDLPFTTSTLLQTASTSLKMSSKKTMEIAQKLYEGITIDNKTIGLITYMRTDSTHVSEKSVQIGREVVKKIYGNEYLVKNIRISKKKIKNAQEAHEAIRPTDPELIPHDIQSFLTEDEFNLYKLIWQRFIAYQMTSAKLAKTTIKISGSTQLHEKNEFINSKNINAVFKVSGTMILFDGFQKVLSDKKDSTTTLLLPKISQNDSLSLVSIDCKKHTTVAPSRYSEASLIKKMEELGIGRPSTYATIMNILQQRQYVLLQKNKFYVEDKGGLVNIFLNSFFTNYVEYNFTAQLEEDLDDIANGNKQYIEILTNFWKPFKINIDEVNKIQNIDILNSLQNSLSELIVIPKNCSQCQNGLLKLKNSKFAPFIGCSNYPECNYTQKFSLYNNSTHNNNVQDVTDNVTIDSNLQIIAEQNDEQITINDGKYGKYISLYKNGIMQKTFTLVPFININDDTLSYELIRKLFDMPFKIGDYKDNEIKIGIGKYGPYVLYKKKFYSIKNENLTSVLNYSLNKAILVIMEKLVE